MATKHRLNTYKRYPKGTKHYKAFAIDIRSGAETMIGEFETIEEAQCANNDFKRGCTGSVNCYLEPLT